MAKQHTLKELPSWEKKCLYDFFQFPYHGQVFVYNNLLTVKMIQDENFHDLLSHKHAQHGFSTAMEIHETIEKAIGSFEGKSVLDVGSSLGHFSFLMAEDGARDITSIEKEPLRAGASRGVSFVKGYQDRVQVVEVTIEEYLSDSSFQYDLVLLLNVFDHMLRENANKAWISIYRMSEHSKNMFLMMGPVDDLFEKVDHTSNIPQVILEKTSFTNWACLIEKSYADRGLFHFWK